MHLFAIAPLQADKVRHLYPLRIVVYPARPEDPIPPLGTLESVLVIVCISIVIFMIAIASR
jgi:hypothetical protein